MFVGHESNPSTCILKRGVPQGSVLGSHIFYCVYSKCSHLSARSSIPFFVDKSQLHSSSVPLYYPALACCLKDCIGGVAEWMSDSKLRMNDDET